MLITKDAETCVLWIEILVIIFGFYIYYLFKFIKSGPDIIENTGTETALFQYMSKPPAKKE